MVCTPFHAGINRKLRDQVRRVDHRALKRVPLQRLELTEVRTCVCELLYRTGWVNYLQ